MFVLVCKLTSQPRWVVQGCVNIQLHISTRVGGMRGVGINVQVNISTQSRWTSGLFATPLWGIPGAEEEDAIFNHI